MLKVRKIFSKYNIALQDFVKTTSISGSSDLDLIKDQIEFNDIEKFLKDYPNIQKVFCNGKASYNLTQKHFPNLEITFLPSTSPANVSFKKEIWFENLKILKKQP